MVPALSMADFSDDNMLKYMFDREFTEEAITGFLNDFFEGKLTPFLKSEDVPEVQTEVVYVGEAGSGDA